MADPVTKAEYVPWLGVTYLDHGDGHTETVQGDQTKNPMLNFGGEATGARLKAGPQARGKMANATRDILVNTASQLPLAIPGLGLPARAALSLATGTGADQLAYPERPLPDSVGNAAINSLIGGITEGLTGGTYRLKMPSPNVGVSGNTMFQRVGLGLHGLSPFEEVPGAVAPGSNMLDLLKNVSPSPASIRANLPAIAPTNLSPAAAKAWNAQMGALATKAATKAAKDQIIKDATKALLKYNVGPGIGANSLFDLFLNAPENKDQE